MNARGAVRGPARFAALAAAAAIALAGCAATPGSEPEASDSGELSGTLSVYAAASLATAFDRIAEEFEAENSGVDILPLVYDGSSTLARQIVEGAPADVFAAADETNMTTVQDAGLVAGSAELFASNTLVIVVPAGNPGGVTSLGDLANPDLSIVLCAPEVPCGAASTTLLAGAGAGAGVEVQPVSVEQNVTAVLTKVATGEADAGLVYRTDVVDRDDVESIVPDGAAEVVNRYPIAALADAANPEAAAAFVGFVLGARGQKILADSGFGTP
ncbi:MAG: molybdate ABC transporter substrate-binding protein [Microbacterium sp.]|uniref:molybdate ABC transporter substrate-binding protein n=1 Tax=Microbacterium sp. TaxID=51671 RepID=UPI00272838BD|nr:molybdate ABC transporter substrate-binding protein [Microbacterium sp.]MDO8383788.1 molybdate ABC transporter substrate-binding protein [Microbacterium sp.]